MPALLPDDDVPAFPDLLAPEAVQALAARGVRRGLTTAFQSLLAASVDAVADAEEPVRAASAAAINLAQQRHVAAVADGLDALAGALRSGLSEQGRALLPAPRRTLRGLVAGRLRPRAAPPPASWDEAMAAATGAVAEAADFVATLAVAQPGASSARILGLALAARLARDRDALADEAARTGA